MSRFRPLDVPKWGQLRFLRHLIKFTGVQWGYQKQGKGKSFVVIKVPFNLEAFRETCINKPQKDGD